MLEERLTLFWTLVSRHRRAQTNISKSTIVSELKELHNTTSSQVVRMKTSNFLSSINAWGQAS